MATDNQDSGTTASEAFDSARKAFSGTAASFSEQASARARDYATQGKDRAVEALDNVAGLVSDAANEVTERLGGQYGGYVQQAADAVSNLAGTLRDKDTDELIDDARNAVRSSPAVAIAAAAAVGFLVARVVKSGLTPRADNDGADEAPEASPVAVAPKPVRKPAVRKATTKAARMPKTPPSDTPPATASAAPSDDTPPAA